MAFHLSYRERVTRLTKLDRTKRPVDILAIESSCDETAAAIIRDGQTVLSSVIASQIETHQRYGGVVPEVASRAHVEEIIAVIDEAMLKAQATWDSLSAIAVTYAPGLIGALFVGVTAAKSLALAHELPLIGVHHLAGHLYASMIDDTIEPAFLALIVSGGHTELVLCEEHGRFERLGHTRDDAAGEAFDKVARAMGLGYPGGPAIAKAALQGDETAIALPRAMLDDSYDFSFSGLKSAVLLHLDKAKKASRPVAIADVAASFQRAVVDVLLAKTALAIQRTGVKTLVLAGGVAANSTLRADLLQLCEELGVRAVIPPLWLCTDNAAMIGAAAYFRYQKGEFDDLDLTAKANLPIDQW